MSSFMEGYGVKEARRGRLILRIAITVFTLAILGTAGYLYFRTWSEERVYSQFKDTLAKQDFDAAYRMWCTAEKPCRAYEFNRFMADWGPASPYAKIDQVSIRHIDYCGDGVVFDLILTGAAPVALWVEHSTGRIDFYPYQRCVGKHLQIGPFFQRLFGGSDKG